MLRLSLLTSLVLVLIWGNSLEAKNRKEFFYSDGIDIFTILDQVSAWSPLHQKNYRKQFKTQFGLTADDQVLIDKYIAIRTKYLHKVKSQEIGNKLFPQDSINLDIFSRAFFTADNINNGLLNLQKEIPSKEFKVIKEFYQHFTPKIQPWLLESKTFETYFKNFKKQYQKGKGHQIIKKIKKFLNLNNKEMRKMYFAFSWAPEHERPKVEMMSNVFLVKIHPSSSMANPDFFHFMTEVIDAMMDAQKEGQKASFSTQFLKECQVPAVQVKDVIKWPLSLAAGGLWFESNRLKKEFQLGQVWSKNPWVQNYSQLLFPILERGLKGRDHIMGTFLKQSGVTCQNLVNLVPFITPEAAPTE